MTIPFARTQEAPEYGTHTLDDAELFSPESPDTRQPLSVCIISAMPEEMEPMRKLLSEHTARSVPSLFGSLTLIEPPCAAAKPEAPPLPALLAVTGIGFTATASCLGWILAHYAPDAIISIGSAGGLSEDSMVRDVVLGSKYRDGGADGTAFGYVRGQVPGQPEFFTADMALLSAGALEALERDDIDIRTGDMLSSDTFVTEANIGDMREAFPSSVTADMESYAAAHVAHACAIPFLSIRGISDLCSKPEDQSLSFHAELSEVAELSARTALATLQRAGVLGNVANEA